ncbi:MAG: hypothetical protein VX223_03360 [Myxococcota bacterium]|nr:hypothetical protein [Myxococcota bacterium]
MLVLSLLVSTGVYAQAPTPTAELPPFSASVQIKLVQPSGAVVPLVNTTAWVVAEQVEPAMGRPKRTTVGRYRAYTGASGTAAFPKIRSIRDAMYTVQCIYAGVSYRTAEFRLGQPAPRELRVYQSSADTSAIQLSSLYELTVSDTMLYVTQLVRVFNTSNYTVDYNYRPDGLRLPTLAFPVAGKVPIHGLFPLGKVHGSPTMTNGQGRIVGEKGAIVYRGPILPGSRSFVRFRYAIPFNTETVDLASVSDVPLRDASVVMTWTTLVQPSLQIEHAATARKRDRGHVSQIEVALHDGLDAGTPLRIRMSRLPIRTTVPMQLATVGGFGFGLLFLSLVAGALWRRRTT